VAAKTTTLARASPAVATRSEPIPAPSLAARTAEYVRRDPVGGVGLAVAAGIALPYLLAPVSRLALRRVHR